MDYVKIPLSPKRAKLRKLLRQHPGMGATELAGLLKCSRQFVYQMAKQEGLSLGRTMEGEK
jgi:hypothetical protein